ncbi:GlsB/YeaQ/YmgE family stress response membrane protein [Candidatus Saccharibacteria bacterium]|nr:MAG: GlsB/YeaQ/YmgE family stress response membrane protein [Candidatus Saccharibacteria bacterium]
MGEVELGLIGWIVLGGLAGWVASMFVGTNHRQRIVGNIVSGIIGGVLGGWIFSFFGGAGVTGFNIWSFVVALVGAIIVLMIWKAISSKRQS